MRRQIVHAGAGSLKYEIREIVEFAHLAESHGVELTWENIGDPLQKGEQPADWIREIVHQLVDDPQSWAYCHSAGVAETRGFLAEQASARPGGVRITGDDILFFNGVGDAVSTVYNHLPREARILGPSPAYSTHSSAEAAHSGFQHLTYQMDPENNWLPDIAEIRNACRYNDSIAGILLLSPDNPTGAVLPRHLLEEIADIARTYELFIISDEIYAHIVFDGNHLHASEWVGDVPCLAMRGISKEYPWPGSRCGWVEVLNRGKDHVFDEYAESLLAAKRLEVSATTLPQLTIPRVYRDERYPGHLASREQMFAARAKEAVEILRQSDAVTVNEPGGGFFMTITFKPGVLQAHQSLPIDSRGLAEHVAAVTSDVALDKRFAYYLIASRGIVLVPLTGFHSKLYGFRVTLLEMDDAKRRQTFETIREAVDAFVGS